MSEYKKYACSQDGIEDLLQERDELLKALKDLVQVQSDQRHCNDPQCFECQAYRNARKFISELDKDGKEV
jgi:flagellar hook-associated protein FlgK